MWDRSRPRSRAAVRCPTRPAAAWPRRRRGRCRGRFQPQRPQHAQKRLRTAAGVARLPSAGAPHGRILVVGAVRVQPALDRPRGRVERPAADGLLEGLEIRAAGRLRPYQGIDFGVDFARERLREAPFFPRRLPPPRDRSRSRSRLAAEPRSARRPMAVPHKFDVHPDHHCRLTALTGLSTISTWESAWPCFTGAERDRPVRAGRLSADGVRTAPHRPWTIRMPLTAEPGLRYPQRGASGSRRAGDGREPTGLRPTVRDHHCRLTALTGLSTIGTGEGSAWPFMIGHCWGHGRSRECFGTS